VSSGDAHNERSVSRLWGAKQHENRSRRRSESRRSLSPITPGVPTVSTRDAPVATGLLSLGRLMREALAGHTSEVGSTGAAFANRLHGDTPPWKSRPDQHKRRTRVWRGEIAPRSDTSLVVVISG